MLNHLLTVDGCIRCTPGAKGLFFSIAASTLTVASMSHEPPWALSSVHGSSDRHKGINTKYNIFLCWFIRYVVLKFIIPYKQSEWNAVTTFLNYFQGKARIVEGWKGVLYYFPITLTVYFNLVLCFKIKYMYCWCSSNRLFSLNKHDRKLICQKKLWNYVF